jgi:hypothetical protein
MTENEPNQFDAGTQQRQDTAPEDDHASMPVGVDNVVNGSITISGLMTGFMLIFIGLVLQDCKTPSWLQLFCLFLASVFLEYFYWVMAKSWNLLSVRVMARTGDRILNGEITQGPALAAFKVLWTFHDMIFLGSRLLFLIVAIYGWTQSWYNPLTIVLGFGIGWMLCAYMSLSRRWKTTWRQWSSWDKSVYLGEPISLASLSRWERFLARQMGEIQEKATQPISLESLPWYMRWYMRLLAKLTDETTEKPPAPPTPPQ